jgi:hypothetical protein
MSETTSATLQYETPRPPPPRRFNAGPVIVVLGLLTVLYGTILFVDGYGAQNDLKLLWAAMFFGFGVTWWILGVILRELMRR